MSVLHRITRHPITKIASKNASAMSSDAAPFKIRSVSYESPQPRRLHPSRRELRRERKLRHQYQQPDREAPAAYRPTEEGGSISARTNRDVGAASKGVRGGVERRRGVSSDESERRAGERRRAGEKVLQSFSP